MAREVYEAKASFIATVDGVPVSVRKGDTVRAGHEILKGREALFDRQTVRFETASAPRGRRKLETE